MRVLQISAKVVWNLRKTVFVPCYVFQGCGDARAMGRFYLRSEALPGSASSIPPIRRFLRTRPGR